MWDLPFRIAFFKDVDVAPGNHENTVSLFFSNIDKLAPVSLLDHYDATLVAFSMSLLGNDHGYKKLYVGLRRERCTDSVMQASSQRPESASKPALPIPTRPFSSSSLAQLETQTEAAIAFRALWGARCELRRFKDASVREALSSGMSSDISSFKRLTT